MESNITLESLIKEQKARVSQLKYKPNPPGCWGFAYYYDNNESYQKWLATTKRYLGIHFLDDKDVNEFDTISKDRLSPEQQKKLLGILEAFALLPTIIPDSRTTQITEKKGRGREAINVTTTINNTNTQAQNQAQTIAIELFLEAIKDDLTGRQIKELKEVVAASNGDLQKAKPGIIEKLKSFGADVASNVIANLITNPAIWASF